MTQWPQWQNRWRTEIDDGLGSMQLGPPSRKPLSVSELARRVQEILQGEFPDIFVEGEVSGFKEASSGHVYFSLKDDAAVVDCVIWRSQVPRVGRLPRDGDHVEVSGSLTTYPKGSRYQIVVSHLQPAGLGLLYQRFMELKERLAREGLFDESRKKALPEFPRVVGVVTSPTGAAIRDIIKILGRRAPHIRIVIYPSRVQGDQAPREIAHAIRRLNELGMADVLIVGRGGGSMQDLWAFNEELVARAIADSRLPVISAVGHETDFTIADFVADRRAPTPSAAAEIVARSSEELRERIAMLSRRMERALRHQLDRLRAVTHWERRLVSALRHRTGRLQRVEALEQRLRAAMHQRRERATSQLERCCGRLSGAMRQRVAILGRVELLQARLLTSQQRRLDEHHAAINRFELLLARRRPLQLVNEFRQHLDDAEARMKHALELVLLSQRNRLTLLSGKLEALDPRGILSRGYSITFDERSQKIIRSSRTAYPGQRLRIMLYEGELGAVVTRRGSAEDAAPLAGPAPDELPLRFDEEGDAR